MKRHLTRDHINQLLRLIHYRLPYADGSEFEILSELRQWVQEYRKECGI